MTDLVPNKDAESKAIMAFDAHCALLLQEAANPALVHNPFWTMLRQDAYERFHVAYGDKP